MPAQDLAQPLNPTSNVSPNVSKSGPPSLDAVAALRWQNLPLSKPLSQPQSQASTQAAGGADTKVVQSPWLHEEVARRMNERLDIIRLQPASWCHWGALRGGLQAHALLAARYPNSEVIIADVAVKHAYEASNLIAKSIKKTSKLAGWQSTAKRWFGRITGRNAARSPGHPPAQPPLTATAPVQMLWANMALHMAPDPQALIAQWHQALAVDGFLMFSCLGPDTLRSLRQLYQRYGWGEPAHEFTDMHDWGDMLVAAGFAEPVMDMERITLSFATPERLLQELRPLGKNLHGGRFGALRGRQWLAQLKTALADELADPREEGRLTLTFEVIYGHALKPAPRMAVTAQTSVSLEAMRHALQRGRMA